MTAAPGTAAVLGSAAEAPDHGGRELVSAARWVTACHLGAQVFAYGSLIFLARLVAPASFGTIAVATAVVYLAVLFIDHGTTGAIVVGPALTRAGLARASCRCVLIGALLAAGMAASSGHFVVLFASGGDPGAVAVLSLCLPLHAVALVPTAILRKAMRWRRLAAVHAIANVVSASAAILAGVAGWGVWALVVRLLGLFALLAVLTCAAAPDVWREALAARADVPEIRTGTGHRWFFLFGVTFVLFDNLDKLIVGTSSGAGMLGLYALAFTAAMAPLTQFSEQVGRLLFAAVAGRPDTAARRTEQSVRLTSLLLLPLLPVGIVLAPVVLPAVLGEQWAPMVVPFQILFVVGVAHAVINCIGEVLAGTGHIAFRAKMLLARCTAALVALPVLVDFGGLTGAAVAQLLAFVPYAVVFLTTGLRRVGVSPAALWNSLRPTVGALAAQVAVTGVALFAWRAAGLPAGAGAWVAVAAGLAVAASHAVPTVIRMRPL